MFMNVRDTKPADGLAFEVELNQHRGLVSHHPPIMPWQYLENLGSHKLQGAAVRVLNVHFAARQKADVSVHAKVGAHNLFHVRGPAKPGWINNPLHATGAHSNDIEVETAHLAVFACIESG